MIESGVLVLSVSKVEDDDTNWFASPAVAPAPVSALVLASLFAEEALSALRNVLLDMLEIALLLPLSDKFFSKAMPGFKEEESFFPNKDDDDDLTDTAPFWMFALRCPKGTLEVRVAMVGEEEIIII
jgi:hypothetical protein